MSQLQGIEVRRPSRRTIATGAAWAVPVIAVGAAAPAMAASPNCVPEFSVVPEESFKCCNGAIKRHEAHHPRRRRHPVPRGRLRVSASSPSRPPPPTSRSARRSSRGGPGGRCTTEGDHLRGLPPQRQQLHGEPPHHLLGGRWARTGRGAEVRTTSPNGNTCRRRAFRRSTVFLERSRASRGVSRRHDVGAPHRAPSWRTPTAPSSRLVAPGLRVAGRLRGWRVPRWRRSQPGVRVLDRLPLCLSALAGACPGACGPRTDRVAHGGQHVVGRRPLQGQGRRPTQCSGRRCVRTPPRRAPVRNAGRCAAPPVR